LILYAKPNPCKIKAKPGSYMNWLFLEESGSSSRQDLDVLVKCCPGSRDGAMALLLPF